MGENTSGGSERASETGTGLRLGETFPGARGECLEDVHRGLCVQLGCGHKPWEGWINVDTRRVKDRATVYADLMELPFKTDSVAVLAAIHVLEHFYVWDAPALLWEWQRVLEPGGLLILELPCLDKVMAYMKDCLEHGKPMLTQMTCWALWGDPRYQDISMCHKWGYTTYSLKALLDHVGFASLKFEEPRYHVKPRDMRALIRKGHHESLDQ